MVPVSIFPVITFRRCQHPRRRIVGLRDGRPFPLLFPFQPLRWRNALVADPQTTARSTVSINTEKPCTFNALRQFLLFLNNFRKITVQFSATLCSNSEPF